MTDQDKILDKVKKCLALSSSSNAHEAEAALRQARKLMEAHSLTEEDVHAAEASEHKSDAGAKFHPALWETMLATKIADAFGSRVIFFGSAYWGEKGRWSFIGCGPDPEIAHYAFDVLVLQAKRARTSHIKTKLKRCKTAIKTRRADLFCEGWVRSVTGVIAAFCETQQKCVAIDAYMAKHYPDLATLKTRNRNDNRRFRDHECHDYAAGCESGRNARLNRGVSGSDQRFIALQSSSNSQWGQP